MGKQSRKKKQKEQAISENLSASKMAGEEKTIQILDLLSNKYLFIFCCALCLFAFFMYYPEALHQDYDVWFHLKYGEHYVNNTTWKIDHTQYSWTPMKQDWIYVTWIGSSLLYIVHKIAGAFGLHALQWLVFLSVFLVFYAYSKVVGDSLDINNLMLLLLVLIGSNLEALYIKPEMFTFTYFVIAVFIYLYTKSKQVNLFYLYPLLFLGWVNTHGAFIFGLFFICAAFGGELLNLLVFNKGLSKKYLKHFAISIVLSYMATLLNPYGFDYHITIYDNLIRENILKSATGVLAYFSLWDHIVGSKMFRFANGAHALLLLAIVFISAFTYGAAKKKEVDFSILGTNLAFFILSMKIARASFFFPILSYMSIIYILKHSNIYHVKRVFAPVAFIIFIYGATLISYQSISFLNHRHWFGSGLANSVPLKEVEFMKKNELPKPIFNDYLIGAYLMWELPEYKVFIDPRYAPYVKQVWPDLLAFNKGLSYAGLDAMNKKYPFKTAIIHMKTMPYVMLFSGHPKWRLVYFDRIAAIFVHESELKNLKFKTTNFNPKRFNELDNPALLVNLFQIYNSLFGPKYSMEILKYYANNVTPIYKAKEKNLRRLEQLALQRNNEIKQMLKKQQQQKAKQ